LNEHNVDFYGNQEWPRNSPDLNTGEHLGAVMKDWDEEKMIMEFPD